MLKILTTRKTANKPAKTCKKYKHKSKQTTKQKKTLTNAATEETSLNHGRKTKGDDNKADRNEQKKKKQHH